MKEATDTKRRTVLKTIGAGVVGGTVTIGSATASTGEDIYLRGHQFTPNQANVRLGGEGGSATVRWTNDEVNYFGEGYPVPHDVHLHHDGNHLESGIFTQMSAFDDPNFGEVELGATFYEVEFREEGDDLVVEETGGKIASTGLEDSWPPIQLIEEYDEMTIKDWGGSVTLDVHCSLHDLALVFDENDLVAQIHEMEDPPYSHHLGFFKMSGGLTITR